MRALTLTFASAAALSAGVVAAGAPAARFIAPLQPYASADGQVHLLRPAVAQVSTSDAPAGSLMSKGWRMVWDGSQTLPGRVVVRLSLPVAPVAPQGHAVEDLRVGASRDRAAVRSCLTYGLKGADALRQPDRVINGRRFAVWSEADAGMSQQVSATNLRAVVAGACYAVDRYRYGDTASDPDPSVTLPQAQGAAMLDRSLASLQLGPLAPGAALAPPSVKLPPHARAY